MRPKLSILIPAYNFPFGVLRILNTIDKSIASKIEIIISDDSKNDDLKKLISEYNLKITYIYNTSALGPAKNWNTLLKKASGEYLYLTHHDEFPSSKFFFVNLLDFLDRDQNKDLLIFNLIKINKNSRISLFLGNTLRKFLIFNFPYYLSLRNFIGPVSSICIRRNLYTPFNYNLKWLTDVLFYISIIEKRPRIHFFSNLTIVSEYDRTSSISSQLKSNPKFLSTDERCRLLKLKPQLSFYLGTSLPSIVFRFLEPIFWYPLAMASRFFGTIRFWRSNI